VFGDGVLSLLLLFQEAIGAAGGLRAAVKAMRQHPRDEGVQYSGTCALQELVKDHAANQVLLDLTARAVCSRKMMADSVGGRRVHEEGRSVRESKKEGRKVGGKDK
jgi:hypothetical protein